MAQQKSVAPPHLVTPAKCDAVILAGGRATRLQSVLSDRPKILAPIAGKPFAHYLLDQIAEAGFARAVICSGHLAEMVEATLGARWKQLELVHSREQTALDTAGALRLALPKLAAEHCVIFNGDTYVRLDFAHMLERWASSGAAAALALIDVPDVQRFGSVVLSPQGLVRSFVEKSEAQAGKRGLVSAGVYAVTKSRIADIPPNRRVSLERDMMPLWLAAGILGYPSPGPFIDIGTPESFAAAQDLLLAWTRAARAGIRQEDVVSPDGIEPSTL